MNSWIIIDILDFYWFLPLLNLINVAVVLQISLVDPAKINLITY